MKVKKAHQPQWKVSSQPDRAIIWRERWQGAQHQASMQPSVSNSSDVQLRRGGGRAPCAWTACCIIRPGATRAPAAIPLALVTLYHFVVAMLPIRSHHLAPELPCLIRVRVVRHGVRKELGDPPVTTVVPVERNVRAWLGAAF